MVLHGGHGARDLRHRHRHCDGARREPAQAKHSRCPFLPGSYLVAKMLMSIAFAALAVGAVTVIALVGGKFLHRPRLALHVHQAEVAARVRDNARELGIAAKRRDVVDELGAERERRRATSAFAVSIETGTSPASRSSTERRAAAPRRAKRRPSQAASTRRRCRRSQRLHRPCAEQKRPRRPDRS